MSLCRECNNLRSKETYAKDPKKVIDRVRAYHLEHLEWSKEFQANWHQQNKERRMEKVKQRLATDPEFVRYRRELSAASNRKRRAQMANTEVEHISRDDYSRLFDEYGQKCWICETTLNRETLVWDHVQPLAKGGSHTVDNLRPACSPCNIRKSAIWPFPDEIKTRIANEVRSLQNPEEVML